MVRTEQKKEPVPAWRREGDRVVHDLQSENDRAASEFFLLDYVPADGLTLREQHSDYLRSVSRYNDLVENERKSESRLRVVAPERGDS